MKIAMINAGPIQGFATSFRSLALARCLVKEGIEVDYIVNFNENDYKIYGDYCQGVRIHYIKDNFRMVLSRWRYNPLFAYRIMYAVLKRFRVLKNINPDIIHVFKPISNSFLPSKILQRLKGKALVLDIDDAEYEMLRINFPRVNIYDLLLRKYLEKFAPFFCDCLIVASKYFYNKYKYIAKNIEYIPNGVFLNEFAEANDKIVKKEYDLKKETALLYLGKFDKCFGADLVIEIFAEVKKLFPDSKLILIGEGQERTNLERMAQKMGIYNSVIFTGYIRQEDVPKFLLTADILLFPQRNNHLNRCRCPLKIREYMAAGKPIVATEIGEVSEVLAGDTLLVKPEADRKEYVNRIFNLIKNEALRNDTGKENRKKAAQFSWEKLTFHLIEIYKSLLVKVQRVDENI